MGWKSVFFGAVVGEPNRLLVDDPGVEWDEPSPAGVGGSVSGSSPAPGASPAPLDAADRLATDRLVYLSVMVGLGYTLIQLFKSFGSARGREKG